ncbi:hypothetical protein Scep_011079 [Stephania cephalantha]|uniref:Glycosyltransferase n=1 Tax=Stephania cephalantha TaxID=152367 RepID=A0AAP0PDW5_9MAGN
MDKEESGMCRRSHVLVFPFPVQGHINPMLQFSKRLASKSLKVTLSTPIYVAKSSPPLVGSVSVHTFSDGREEEGAKEESYDSYIERFKVIGSKTIAALVEKYSGTNSPINCIVFDSVLPWAADVARRLGMVGASFYTQSLAVNAVYFHVQSGKLSLPVSSHVSLPGLPVLESHDLPSFVVHTESYPGLLKLVLSQFSNLDGTDLLLFNTFDKLEEEVLDWMGKQWPAKTLTIGPTFPSMYLDKRVEGDEDYGLHLFKPDTGTCMSWLDKKEAGSVVYASFGSLASLGDEQMNELAMGLKTSGNPFLWVVRATEENKLPSKFAEEVSASEEGLVVTWCPQLDVLSHKAVGCFLTHSGWNSTLEALSFGVPMIAMPQWTDQTTNAKYVEEVWKVGVRVHVDEKGIIGRDEIKHCINEILEGERGKEIKSNAAKLREFAKEAVDEGGSSDKNIEKFIETLVSKLQ